MGDVAPRPGHRRGRGLCRTTMVGFSCATADDSRSANSAPTIPDRPSPRRSGDRASARGSDGPARRLVLRFYADQSESQIAEPAMLGTINPGSCGLAASVGADRRGASRPGHRRDPVEEPPRSPSRQQGSASVRAAHALPAAKSSRQTAAEPRPAPSRWPAVRSSGPGRSGTSDQAATLIEPPPPRRQGGLGWMRTNATTDHPVRPWSSTSRPPGLMSQGITSGYSGWNGVQIIQVPARQLARSRSACGRTSPGRRTRCGRRLMTVWVDATPRPGWTYGDPIWGFNLIHFPCR